MKENEGMAFSPMLSYPDIFDFLTFYPSELGSKGLSDYKNSKAYSYYKSGWLQILQCHNLSGSQYCIRGECRKSQSIKDPFHKLWIILLKTTKIRTCQWTCVAGMGETCNHVAAAMYRVEASVRIGLTNPACTSNANEWLPNRKTIELKKIKDLDFSRHGFGQRGTKKRPLVASPKKRFDLLKNCDLKLLSIKDFAEAINKVSPQSMLHTAVTKPKVDFVRELISQKIVQPKKVLSISDVINMSKNVSKFKENLSVFTKENIETIEKLTMGQSENEHLFEEYRKCLITLWKAHEVFTKMTKAVEKGGGGKVNMWSLNQKISGLVFVRPNIPALKYGRDMEIEAANTFTEFIKRKHTDIKLSDYGLFVDENYHM